jgi:hypothetical protein
MQFKEDAMRSCWKDVPTFAAMMVLATPASAGIYALNVMPSGAQSIRYTGGISSIESFQKSTAVRIVNVPGQNKNSVTFAVAIENRGSAPFNFGPENVTVRPAEMQAIALTTYEQAMDAERKRQARENFRAGLAAFGRGLSAAQSGTTYSSGIYSGTSSGYVGGNLVTVQSNGIYSGTQYDPGAAMADQRNARELNAEDQANLDAQRAARSAEISILLRTTTVDPGAMYGGVVTFPVSAELKKARAPVQVSIEVNVAGERHVFVGALSKAQ